MSHTNSHSSVVMYLHRLRDEELQRTAGQHRRRRELRGGRPQKRARARGLRRFLGTLRTALHRRAALAPRP